MRSSDEGEAAPSTEHAVKKVPKKRRRRKRNTDAEEQRLLGRRSLCKPAAEIAQSMLKTVKLRVLAKHLDSKRGMDDAKLTERLIHDAKMIVGREQILQRVKTVDPSVHRRNLEDIIINVILLQEETYSLEERKLEERVLEYEKQLIKKAKSIDLFDTKKHDPKRAHNYDTYRIVLDAAWRNNDDISLDEAQLLRVLRKRLDISFEEHRLMSAHLKRFPKANCELHTRDEIHDARKELQREGFLWSYRDDNSGNIDIIPLEVAEILRSKDVLLVELQKTNYRRLLQHDYITMTNLREILIARKMDRYGNKAELIDRIAESDIPPSAVLSDLDRSKLTDMCRLVGLKSSGAKNELCNRLIEFYDDLTFEERETQDEREEWYNNYELLANRSYSDLRAKKLISKDLDVEHQFEHATDFLFAELLNLKIDNSRKVTKSDGRILLNNRQVILWDCKSAESAVNLQNHLDSQFDEYLRKEREKGFEPLAMLVIGPAFTPNSVKLAYQYKARTNWDIALVNADALKHVAEHWVSTETEQPFPIGLFNRTELIDMDRAEFLISLA
ncbi:MAG: hypothetical protein IID46_05300 [Planctomycetes bacterium]|nr:hypothetical protein [Planctomycetota bacterium]